MERMRERESKVAIIMQTLIRTALIEAIFSSHVTLGFKNEKLLKIFYNKFNYTYFDNISFRDTLDN